MKTVVSSIKTTTANAVNNSNGNNASDMQTTIIPKTEPDNSSTVGGTLQAPNSNNNYANKRPASLDLNKTTKRPRFAAPLLSETVNTPELEKIILSNNLIQTPKPGTVFCSKIGDVTTAQEEYAKGFEEALSNIRKKEIAQTNATTNNTTSTTNNTIAAQTATVTTAGAGMSGGSFTYTNLDNFPVVVKDEPQNPPVSPNVQPIDMENQELIKLERKRLRNRVAASKCRKRKLERISKLEDKVKVLKGENTELGAVLKSLKEHVAQLKQEVIEHLGLGCSIPSVCNGNTLLSAK